MYATFLYWFSYWIDMQFGLCYGCEYHAKSDTLVNFCLPDAHPYFLMAYVTMAFRFKEMQRLWVKKTKPQRWFAFRFYQLRELLKWARTDWVLARNVCLLEFWGLIYSLRWKGHYRLNRILDYMGGYHVWVGWGLVGLLWAISARPLFVPMLALSWGHACVLGGYDILSSLVGSPQRYDWFFAAMQLVTSGCLTVSGLTLIVAGLVVAAPALVVNLIFVGADICSALIKLWMYAQLTGDLFSVWSPLFSCMWLGGCLGLSVAVFYIWWTPGLFDDAEFEETPWV